ncbi:MAG TPA: PaaI family thioesterase [Chlamydiales bacterium]|jgi:1,4-dihydroxy-2-naphthoyl-CoA hydrolase
MQHSIWITPLTLADANSRARNGLSEHLQIEFVDVGPNFLTARMPVGPFVMQPLGSLHGGASAALAETVGSVAANYCVDPATKMCLGLDLNINHVRPVAKGWVDAVARPLHLGKTTQVWDIQIHSHEKKLIAVGRLTIAVILRK